MTGPGASSPGLRDALRMGSAIALLVVAALPGCRAPEADGRVGVAVSVPPQAYFVDRLGGDRVSVSVMVPPGSSPDTYEPSPRQVLELDRARLYVEVGLADFPFERRTIAAAVERRPELVVADMSKGLELAPLDGPPAPSGARRPLDPHIWLSPANVARGAEMIAEGLTRVDPAGAEAYRANLADFLGEIKALDRELAATLGGLAGGKFFVYHPAWGYFARRYGLVQVAIEAEGKDPSPARLVELIEVARAEGVRVVFVQQGFSERSALVLAAEIGARVVALDPLAYDWPQSLRATAAALRLALDPAPSPTPSEPRDG